MALKRLLELVCDLCHTKKVVDLLAGAEGQAAPPVEQMIGWYNIVTDTVQGPETYLVCSGKCMKEVAELAMKATLERKV